ncbi:MAG: hypothetical protein II771_06590, partial [Clostridia bacterium]|nr:hypothetical protein [Clostridia bacterium]
AAPASVFALCGGKRPFLRGEREFFHIGSFHLTEESGRKELFRLIVSFFSRQVKRKTENDVPGRKNKAKTTKMAALFLRKTTR